MTSGPKKPHMHERKTEERYDMFNRSANARKREVYWIGFLEGTLSSKRIESGEEEALLAEAEKFAEFFNDPDASDLKQDIDANCFSSEADFIDQLKHIAATKRNQISSLAPYSETDEMNEFLGFCSGIICDGRILQSEAEAILGRFQRSTVLMTAAPFRRLRQAVEWSLEDRVFTSTEAEEIREWIAQLVGDGYIDTGLPNIDSVAQLDDLIVDPLQINLKGANVVLTGPMKIGTKAFIAREIGCSGGCFQEGTTKKTDYVVVSSNASRHWKTTHFGTKIQHALKLIDKGHKLRFVSESALEQALKIVIQSNQAL